MWATFQQWDYKDTAAVLQSSFWASGVWAPLKQNWWRVAISLPLLDVSSPDCPAPTGQLGPRAHMCTQTWTCTLRLVMHWNDIFADSANIYCFPIHICQQIQIPLLILTFMIGFITDKKSSHLIRSNIRSIMYWKNTLFLLTYHDF